MTSQPTTAVNFDEIERLMMRQRAIRLFTDQPVDDSLIERALRAATRAPSGGNSQPWRFIVIRNRETKAALGKIFDELGKELYGDHAPEHTPWGDVPVLIAVCSRISGGAIPGGGGSSVFPAVQNLLLAIQGLGLGSVLTTRWKIREAEARPLLGLPDDMEVHSILPVGWPAKRYGRGTRKPVAEVTFREKFGDPW